MGGDHQELEKSLFQRKVFENIHYTPPSYFHYNISVHKKQHRENKQPTLQYAIGSSAPEKKKKISKP